ncbi:MAG: hypothetical protein GWN00_24770, partial [Aliifodinibius sp.]|nr:hypothetical protein [Fodinibius sp.]NIV14078.1 hypothetical protein [Fodinibius sp.]NIY27899.1 hypothetical protein [Fodinibius sp.]
VDVDNNLLVVFEKNPVEITDTSDESGFSIFLRKYIEYGVISRAYGANTDGRIDSLADYWNMRHEVGVKM